jgi:hypothetical protein
MNTLLLNCGNCFADTPWAFQAQTLEVSKSMPTSEKAVATSQQPCRLLESIWLSTYTEKYSISEQQRTSHLIVVEMHSSRTALVTTFFA